MLRILVDLGWWRTYRALYQSQSRPSCNSHSKASISSLYLILVATKAAVERLGGRLFLPEFYGHIKVQVLFESPVCHAIAAKDGPNLVADMADLSSQRSSLALANL